MTGQAPTALLYDQGSRELWFGIGSFPDADLAEEGRAGRADAGRAGPADAGRADAGRVGFADEGRADAGRADLAQVFEITLFGKI